MTRFSVLDENGNVLLLNSTALLDHGVARGEFELHRDAPPGEYKIVYEALVRWLHIFIMFTVLLTKK